jgi:hypothetical protein
VPAVFPHAQRLFRMACTLYHDNVTACAAAMFTSESLLLR